jgi:hypothetical protein
MRQYHVIPKTGTPAIGPLSAAQVVDVFNKSTDAAKMLVWWQEQKDWTNINACISEIRKEAKEAQPAPEADPLPEVVPFIAPAVMSDGIPAGQVRVTRDNVSLGDFHEPDVPALLRAKVLQPTDTYMASGMTKPATLSELLLALLLKPSAPHQLAPQSNAGAGVVTPALPQSQRLDSGAGGASPSRGKCCPRCHSEDIRTFEMVYKSGSSSANSIGITMSGELGQARTRSMTDLASEVAPPDMSGPGCFSIIISVGLGMIVGALIHPMGGPLIGGILGLVARVGIHLAGAGDRDQQNEKWRKSWMCMKCGNKFIG